MNSNTDGFLARAVDADIIDLVGINEVKFLRFHQQSSPFSSLGVKGLSACSVMIYASESGAIVAHIGPNILGSQDPHSPLTLAHGKMNEVDSFCNENRDCFSGGSRSRIIFATFQGNITSLEQVQVMEGRVRQLPGVDSASFKYERRDPTEITDRGPYGTVWIDARAADFPRIYVEYEDITMQAVVSQSSSSSAPIDSTWDGEYYVSTQSSAYV
jgi:hypothetical protein